MPVGKYFYNLPDTGGKEKEGDKESSATEGEGSEEELTTTSGIIPFLLMVSQGFTFFPLKVPVKQ